MRLIEHKNNTFSLEMSDKERNDLIELMSYAHFVIYQELTPEERVEEKLLLQDLSMLEWVLTTKQEKLAA
jgi:hypothetical protein